MNPAPMPPAIRRPAQRSGMDAVSYRAERIMRTITDRPWRSLLIVLAVAVGVGLAIAIIAASTGIQTKVNSLVQPVTPSGDAPPDGAATGGIDINAIHDVLNQTRDLLTHLAIGFTAVLVGLVTWVTMGQRRREIAIERRQGAHRIDIVIGLLGESLLLCVVGGVVGIAFGYLLCALLKSQVTLLPLDPSLDGIIAIFPWTTLLSFAATAVVAAYFATKRDADVSY